jgi:hypothetical protein
VHHYLTRAVPCKCLVGRKEAYATKICALEDDIPFEVRNIYFNMVKEK